MNVCVRERECVCVSALCLISGSVCHFGNAELFEVCVCVCVCVCVRECVRAVRL